MPKSAHIVCTAVPRPLGERVLMKAWATAWVRVDDGKTRASLTLAPTEGGIRVGLSVTF